MPKINAYLAHSYRKPADLIGLDQEELTRALSFTAHNMDGAEHWVRVGTAEVTVTLHPMSEITANAIASLRQELQNVRAEAQMKATQIEGQIANLLAITCDEVSA